MHCKINFWAPQESSIYTSYFLLTLGGKSPDTSDMESLEAHFDEVSKECIQTVGPVFHPVPLSVYVSPDPFVHLPGVNGGLPPPPPSRALACRQVHAKCRLHRSRTNLGALLALMDAHCL